VAYKIKPPKNQPQFSQTTMGQYWLDKTKPKQAFRLKFQKVAMEFLKKLFNGIFF